MEDLGGEHMKSFVTRISYKMLITTMMTILLSFFVVTSCVHANKFSDLVNEDGIYYTGTQEAKVTIKGGIFDNIINTLSSIANYLLGLMTIGIRAVFIGWIELAEMFLTWVLDMNREFVDILMDSTGVYSQNVVNVESILFNKVPILNANIFENVNNNTQQPNNIVEIIRVAVAKWYYILRLIAIAFMLLVLIFVGIKMAISTIASEKAVYKQMLVDWVAGMIIVFTIHYMMIAIFAVNDSIIAGLQPLLGGDKQIELEEYQYGIEKDNQEKSRTYNELETTLYESARTRAYSLKLTDGFTGMIIYGVLVYYAWRFAIKYFIRVFNIMILTLVAPVISASYALNKVMTGKSKIFSGWLTEYIVNVIVQMFHVIIYVSFVAIALKLSAESLPGAILAFVLLHFMLEGEKFLRTLFKMSGSKGSLSGEMDRIGLQEIKSGMKSLPSMMTGGVAGKALMKQTYRLATKPARVVVGKAFEKHMAEKAQKMDEEDEERQEELQRIQDTINKLKEEKKDKENEIAEKKKLEKQIEEKELDRAIAYNSGATDSSDEMKEIQKELYELYQKREEMEKNQKRELDEIDDDIQTEEMLRDYVNVEKRAERQSLKSGWENLWDAKNYVERQKVREKDQNGKFKKDANGNYIYARDERGRFIYEKDENGNYVYRSIKTLREGGENAAFWRQKRDSVSKRFMENAKWQNLLGIDSKEEKELQKQYKFWKSSILGLASAFVGLPTLVVNPTLAIGLLGQSTVAGLNYATKKRQVRNRPRYKRNKSYKVTDFNRGARYTMQVEAARQVKERRSQEVHEIERRHPKIVKRILSGDTYQQSQKWEYKRFNWIGTIDNERLEILGELKYRRKLKTVLDDYYVLEGKRKEFDYKMQLKEMELEETSEAENLGLEQLGRNDKLAEDNVIGIGTTLFGIDLDDDLAQKQDKFLDKVEKIDENNLASREEKLKQIKGIFKNNKNDLIQNQITKYYAQRGINDISSANMSQDDMVQIKQNVLGVLEKKGIIKKGELKLEDNIISNEDVLNGYDSLNANKDETNSSLEQKISADAILEYMQKNNITDLKFLQSDLAKDEIYDLIKNKMMTDAQKIVTEIRGQDAVELSDEAKSAVEENINKIKKIKANTKTDKEKLIKRQVNRKMNQTKNQLEEAICADTIENITDERTLDLLFTLSELGENNRKAVEIVGKKTKSSKGQLEILDFYSDGSRKVDKNKDGSRRFDQSRDGSQRVVEEIFMDTKRKNLERRMFGPKNVLDVINNIR